MRAVLKAASVVGATTAILIAGTALWLERPAISADHLDPPARTNVGSSSDVAADIADVYTWHDDTKMVIALSAAGPQVQGTAPIYDRDVLYRVHLSNDGDPTTDEAVIDVRYGKNAANAWGVEFRGVPGASAAISGPVQTEIDQGAIKAEAGLFDDPFFFDLQGFNDTKATGKLSIINTRNFFAGKNDTSFIVEFPRAGLEVPGKPVTVWAETRRIPTGVS